MTKPLHHICDIVDCKLVLTGWPVDQNDRQSQGPGDIKLGACAATARVFGDDVGDAVGRQKGQIAVVSKGPARDNDCCVAQRKWPFRRIDEAQKVMMLRGYGEILKMLTTNGKEDSRRCSRQGGGGGGHVRHALPLVTWARPPSGTLQRKQRNVGDFGGFDSVFAHLGGKWMGGVDDMGDTLCAQVVNKARDAAKAADADKQGLGDWGLRPTGVRKNARNPLICHGFSKIRGFSGSSQQKGAGHG